MTARLRAALSYVGAAAACFGFLVLYGTCDLLAAAKRRT